jgi:hypothetical protein
MFELITFKGEANYLKASFSKNQLLQRFLHLRRLNSISPKA